MPALTNSTYGQGRGRAATDATLAPKLIDWFDEIREDTTETNGSFVVGGEYVALMADEFSGPKSKVGDALLAHFGLDVTEFHAPQRPSEIDGAEVEVTIRPLTEARKVSMGLVPATE